MQSNFVVKPAHTTLRFFAFAALYIASSLFSACSGRTQKSASAERGSVSSQSETDADTAGKKPESLTAVPVVGDFTLKDVNGASFTLSEHLGNDVIVLAFFATWCEPCQKELSHLEQFAADFQDRGLSVWAVSMDLPDTVGEVRPLVKRLGLSFPVLLDDGQKATDLFNPQKNAPFSVVIDRNKNMIWSHLGYVPGDEEKLKDVILSALDGKSGDAAPNEVAGPASGI